MSPHCTCFDHASFVLEQRPRTSRNCVFGPGVYCWYQSTHREAIRVSPWWDYDTMSPHVFPYLNSHILSCFLPTKLHIRQVRKYASLPSHPRYSPRGHLKHPNFKLELKKLKHINITHLIPLSCPITTRRIPIATKVPNSAFVPGWPIVTLESLRYIIQFRQILMVTII